MLANEDVVFIEKNFGCYDHLWRYYAGFLGEPFLLDDLLVYFDGVGLFIAAFPFGDEEEVARPKIESAFEKAVHVVGGNRISFVNIWGRFPKTEQKMLNSIGISYPLLESSDYYTSMFDTVMDLSKFSYETSSKARRRKSVAIKRGYRLSLRKRISFSWRHLSLIEQWAEKNSVSVIHRQFTNTLMSYLHNNSVTVYEAYDGNTLIGFSVVQYIHCIPTRAVEVATILEKTKGSRAGDFIFCSILDDCLETKVGFIHRGYSATESLLRTKESWGGCTRSDPFREEFFYRDSHGKEILQSERYLWGLRLLK
jgi:hypothetical protein